MAEGFSLIKLDAFTQALAEAQTIPEVKNLADQADLFKRWLKKQGAGKAAWNTGAIMCLEAQRKLGEMLGANPKITKGSSQMYHDGTFQNLSLLGIDRHDSSRWQKLAEIPEEDFREFCQLYQAEVDGKVPEITTVALMRYWLTKRIDDFPPAPPLPTGIYNVFYADPPWPYANQQHSKEEQVTTINTQYPPEPIEEICAKPISIMAADDAVLFLWTTSPFLEDSFKVINSWGFDYKTSMIWDKAKHNVGYYVSVRHEFLLISTKGSMLPEVPTLFDSVQTIERSDIHSEKPEVFYEIIEALYPSGKYIELYARKKRLNWEAWGNEL